MDKKILALKEHAKRMRVLSLRMANRCGGSAHLGGGLSLIEAVAVLRSSDRKSVV